MLDNNIDFIRLFERKLSEYTGFSEAVCTDCCTNALLISLEALYRNKVIDKANKLDITCYTYMSVPMTLVNNGWKIDFVDDKWKNSYQLGKTNVYDAATDLHENMANDYSLSAIVCISFQQKKRLSLGRGGAILLNNSELAKQLRRLVYDGRNPYISNNEEIATSSDDIVCGYHCYMDPEKAAVGIAKLNQINLLQYRPLNYTHYADLRALKCLQ